MREGEYGALLGDPIEGNEEVGIRNEELGIRNEELEMKVAASPPFLEDGILVSAAFPSRGRLIKSPSHQSFL